MEFFTETVDDSGSVHGGSWADCADPGPGIPLDPYQRPLTE